MQRSKTYSREQCLYGRHSTMQCKYCTAICPERRQFFKQTVQRVREQLIEGADELLNEEQEENQ